MSDSPFTPSPFTPSPFTAPANPFTTRNPFTEATRKDDQAQWKGRSANGSLVVVLPDEVADRYEADYGDRWSASQRDYAYELDGEALRVIRRVRHRVGDVYIDDPSSWSAWNEGEVAFYRPEQWSKVRLT